MKVVSFTQATVPCKAGVKGTKGSSGSSGSNGTAGSNATGNGNDGGNGGPGGNAFFSGGNGGDGGHTTFGNETTATATDISTPTIKFGATEFEHGLGGSDQDGGVVMYLIW